MIKILFVFLLALSSAQAAPGVAEAYPQAKSFFPEADRFGELEGEPRAAPVFREIGRAHV